MRLRCTVHITLIQWIVPNLSRYYAASLILGTVALAYGSVPLYKMVRLPSNHSITFYAMLTSSAL